MVPAHVRRTVWVWCERYNDVKLNELRRTYGGLGFWFENNYVAEM